MSRDRKVPERISRLTELTNNLWWSWAPEGRDLFRRLNYNRWLHTRHNAYKMLQEISDEDLEEAAKDQKFLELYDTAIEKFDQYMNVDDKWFTTNVDNTREKRVAYFSMEFGLHQSLPIYSGGLGVLAGDTLKEASDLAIPMCAVGYLYGRGYFTQQIPTHGWQEAKFEQVDKNNVPLSLVKEDSGDRLLVQVTVGIDTVTAQVWELAVGTITLYLIDTDIEENKPWYRGLSHRLYGGDQEMRINQEIVLASAGIKVLEKVGFEPSVWHLNEGHCAFLTLRRMADLVEKGSSFDEAFNKVKNSTVFTTHTPVPAGHDAFPIHMVEDKLPGLNQKLGISKEEFYTLGLNLHNDDDRFNMTVLGINTSHLVNGVSQLHYEVTQKMWEGIFEDRKEDTELIGITNGCHTPTFISGYMRRLFEEYVDPDWMNKLDDTTLWDKLDDIPDDEFWEAHIRNKERLLEYIRETAREYRKRGVMDAEQILAFGTFLDPRALTIGFARRFATYKRANLIFKDIQRIRKMLNDPYRPIQLVFAGKAHPADEPGKHVLQSVYKEALAEENGGRVAFIENYDMHSAKYLVQGVDVWLNNPIRPHEASGTSGMKAAQNGIPHLSTLDGWWVESADHGNNGWVIGGGEELDDQEAQDLHDVNSLYEILENEVIPLYYDQDDDRVPSDWIKLAKEAVKTSISKFSMKRMIKEYVERMYKPTFDKN